MISISNISSVNIIAGGDDMLLLYPFANIFICVKNEKNIRYKTSSNETEKIRKRMKLYDVKQYNLLNYH
jgi:hypothetical protein